MGLGRAEFSVYQDLQKLTKMAMIWKNLNFLSVKKDESMISFMNMVRSNYMAAKFLGS